MRSNLPRSIEHGRAAIAVLRKVGPMTAAQLADALALRGYRFALGSHRANLVADGLRRLRRFGEDVRFCAGCGNPRR